MSPIFLSIIVVLAVVLLLFMVLKLKISAFIALLITAIFVGIAAGMPLSSVTKSIQEGMAGTLGFVATVVGLGAIFGQMLESSGGAESLAHYLIKNLGKIVYRGRLHLQVSLLLSRFSMLGSLFLFQLFILFLAIPGSRYFIMLFLFLQV